MLIPTVRKMYSLHELDYAVISAITSVYNSFCLGKMMEVVLYCCNNDEANYELYYRVSLDDEIDERKFVSILNDLFGAPVFRVETEREDEIVVSMKLSWTPIPEYYESGRNISPKEAYDTVMGYVENLKKKGVLSDLYCEPMLNLLSNKDLLRWGVTWYIEVQK